MKTKRKPPRREPRPSWQAELAPFGPMYHAFEAAVIAELEKYEDAGLRKVIEAAGRVGESNCWYATYEVAPIVAAEARRSWWMLGWTEGR